MDNPIVDGLPLVGEREGLLYFDMAPELVGQVGMITNAHKTQGIDRYSIQGIPGKVAWYDNGQLELA
jgi:hypothetical protein